jgi:hypothetical protein
VDGQIAPNSCRQFLAQPAWSRWQQQQWQQQQQVRRKMAGQLPACAVDCGMGYTKLGYAENTKPHLSSHLVLLLMSQQK